MLAVLRDLLAASLLPAPPRPLTATHRSDPLAPVLTSKSEDGVSGGKPTWRWTRGPPAAGEAGLPGEGGKRAPPPPTAPACLGEASGNCRNPWTWVGGPPSTGCVRGNGSLVTGSSWRLQSWGTHRPGRERHWGTVSQAGPGKQGKTKPGSLCP